MNTILLIEDEPEIRRFVRQALVAESVQVHEADSVARGLIEAGTRNPDLVILDLGLPDGDGVDLIRELRTWSQIPILVLSARGDEKQKIIALDAGADDYLTKPFGLGELLARVHALQRRIRNANNPESTFRFGEVKVDLAARTVRKDIHLIRLTPIEYRLLTCLIANAGRVLTYRHLVREVWGTSHSDQAHYARIVMQHLRQKLEDDPTQPKYLLTETGVGYRLVQDSC